MMFTSTIVGIQHVRAGKLRSMGVTSATRQATMPDVPTIAETFPGFEVTAWFGMVAPAGTPAPILKRLNEGLQAVLKSPEVIKRLEDLGAVPAGGPASELTALFRSELPKWHDVIRAGNIKPE